MDIDEALVRHVALLARLELTDDEVHEITPQMRGILAYVEQVQQIEVGDEEPATQAPIELEALRDDEPGTTLDPDVVMRGAPAHDGTYFVVPRVFEEGAHG